MREDIIAYGALIIFIACMFGVVWFGIKEILNNAPDEEE